MTPERFWARVDRSGGPDACWPWMGERNRDGYGVVRAHRRNLRAHRVARLLSTGSLVPELDICHHCDNPPCCNPAHLRAGTQADNSRDMVERGRSLAGDRNPSVIYADRRPRGSSNGHSKLTEEEVAVIKRRLLDGDPMPAIAADFRVTHGAVWFIARGVNWRHVEPAS